MFTENKKNGIWFTKREKYACLRSKKYCLVPNLSIFAVLTVFAIYSILKEVTIKIG